MRFTVSSTALSSSLQSISRVISTKNTLPILDNFLFKITDGELLATASDLETTLTTAVEISGVTGNGSVAISAKLLLDILNEFNLKDLAVMQECGVTNEGAYDSVLAKASSDAHILKLVKKQKH